MIEVSEEQWNKFVNKRRIAMDKVKEMLEQMYKKHKRDRMDFDDELMTSDEFQKGCVYGRSVTIKGLLDWVNSNG